VPDEPNTPQDPHNANENASDLPEVAPSTLFVEMMRQVAARRVPAEPEPEPELEMPIIPSVTDALKPTPAPEQPVVEGAPAPIQRERLSIGKESAPLRLPDIPVEAVPPPPAPPPPAPISSEKMEAQRVQRVKRRQERVRVRRVGIVGGFVRTLILVILAGFLSSTIFTWFTSPDFLDRRVVTGLVVANSTVAVTQQPTQLPTPNYLRKVGIVSGHRGPENDPGAVCPDGLTESSINFDVATRVVRNLRTLGYSVDLLDEFDARLNNYQAASLVSIHANTCQDFGEYVSGYLVAKAAVRPEGGPDTLLAECLAREYGKVIEIERRFSLTVDMTDYHTFREIHPLTAAAIIELGFMKDDRTILTTRQDDMAQAITEGVVCFLNPPAPNPNAEVIAPDAITTTPDGQ